MCIISQPAEVTETKIFVALNAPQTRQLTVYENKVVTVSGAVMILPVPDPLTIEMIDLSAYPTIFKDLNAPFQTLSSYNGQRSFSCNDSLAVTKVGGYLVTIVPSTDEFPNLSAHTFGTVHRDIVNLLHERYPTFGFVICKLNPAETKYHPIAYSHTALGSGQLFVPTYHLHNHGNNDGFQRETLAHWDHDIFSLNVPGNPQSTASFTKSKIPFHFPPENIISKLSLKGFLANMDITQKTNIAPTPEPLTMVPTNGDASWCSIQ